MGITGGLMATKEIDWEAIERDFRAGILSLREMSKQYGVSHVAIKKRADKFGWDRDLSGKIKAKAEALVNSREVNTEVNTQSTVNERAVIEANAEVIAQVRISHRRDISRSRKLVIKLLEELELQTDNRELYEKLGEMMRREDDKGIDKLNDLYNKVISLAGRTKTMKDLADSLKTLVALERQAYNLDTDLPGAGDDESKSSNMTELARRLAFILMKAEREKQ
jgi:hypothetical protein